MSEKEAFYQEKSRVSHVVHYIEQQLKELNQYIKRLKGDVIDLRKDFFDDVTVNLTEADDAIETQASLKQQAEFLSERERNHYRVYNRRDQLNRLKDKPYFGRIDFIEGGETETEVIYIGTSSLLKENEEDFYVYDWRAPISSMYYDFAPGAAHYQALEETVQGEMTLKRQYVIKQGELEGMFDTGLTIGDGLLQKVLGETADTRMKNIVATIQREQNQIIRHEKRKPLIVRGVAGSGKTSAALQRIAYLLYRHRGEMTSDQMILFSPNPLFNSYVARVLPELGENQVQQMTFYHHIERELGNRFVIESPFDQMEIALSETVEPVRLQNMQVKATTAYKDLIDDFLHTLKGSGMVFRNIRFRDVVILSKVELKKYFYQFDDEVPIQERLEQMRRYILRIIKAEQKRYLDAEWLESEIELLDLSDFQEAYKKLEAEHDQLDWFNDDERERELLKTRLLKRLFKPLIQKVKRLTFVDTKKTYVRFLDQWAVTDQTYQEIATYSKEQIRDNFLSYEDATPFLYFERVCLGFDEQRSIKHVILDEAQDYSPFQIAYLERMYPASQLTLLGDINQSIYLHSLNKEQTLKPEDSQADVMELLKSYRSTEEIVNFTKQFLGAEGEKIKPFNRKGPLPEVFEVEHQAMMNYAIFDQLTRYEKEGYQQIAVITKTMQEATRVYDWLKQHKREVSLVTSETHDFEPGIKVIPVYLAKGIEFDAVVVYDASADRYQTALGRHLLYTAATRAMHELTLISVGELPRFITAIDTTYFHYRKVIEIQKS
ncbi:DNA helicase-2/ATP-dependent DNA helicase PcrA [Streptohalobacillus salinus]|uniref:DNA helicase-2/ATP-dependent DNA helicase PcrA n=1 Tax=Streptohalobacillus salinus TaxID=621096 RepID=A0A2V3WFX9_9BACI|nr:RNA polymerase recycling motor HelD [Streptohalobacillus salinus]PXW92150.1 DNA helicase-2/ATP-dependent DNA helicase PcrA [Streptohalobacillus salinus]